jgi:putative hydrolase of the HAD superfamily
VAVGSSQHAGSASRAAATPDADPRIDAIFLDIGGVMLLPDVGVLADELAAAGIRLSPESFWRAHYFGVAGLDRYGVRPGAWAEGYVEGVLAGLDYVGAAREQLRRVLMAARRMSDSDFWRWPVPGSFEALRELAGTRLKIAFVSNSDGTAERKLVSMGLSQVGPGPGVPVDAILDSTVVGATKPDPAIFRLALDTVGVRAEHSVFVGDSCRYDVHGAEQAGLIPLHFDPFRICPDDSHRHIRGLAELLDLV